MSVNVNVFSWIRDAVRRSVLLGFSDAMAEVGAAPDDEVSPMMKGLLQTNATGSKTIAAKKTTSRKRLGRSLKEMDKSKD